MSRNERIERMRHELATRQFDDGHHWRILFLGRSVNGSTDIVSCLSRSLRNLGHRVLDLDVKRHRGLVDNPFLAQGGNGPIYVRADALETVIARFRPQMIVCCAGGLVFREDDAQRLKDRGIVLVGITLSDPDVFPSVHPHVHTFDVHTTNAQTALSMYRDAGVHNTLYFPFGIDRGFVTQSVAHAPELVADVVCIGHATSRPERNGVMTRLAREFDVRTYGRGWDLPRSEVVEGRRMVQAARAGRIHVNFPLTRAGYVNIKCGIFESVGAGALVATGRFPEMQRFFDYDNEILGYTDEDDLARQLHAVLESPERYRAMTERAFERLVNHHLYEHRWMDLFAELLSIVRTGGSWLGPEREASIAATLESSLPRARHVVLSGFYGASNVGDELILRSISERLEAADPAAQVWVAAENPAQVELQHGLQSFSRKSLPQALHAARSASAVVLGGGGLWHDYTFERAGGLAGLFSDPRISIAGFAVLPLFGRMFDVPFHVVGMGIGPLEDPDARRMVRYLAAHAESVTVRDAESMAIAREVCTATPLLRQSPDVVYALELPATPVPDEIAAFRRDGRRVLGLNLRPWAACDEEAMVEAVVEALRTAAASRGPLAVVGVPMQAGERLDPAVLARVAERIGPEIPVFLPRAPLHTEALLSILSSVDALVSMRLHACLLAHRLGRPVVGIAYDPKVANHFRELGRSALCMTLPLDADALAAAVVAALDERGTLPDAARERIAGIEREAADALSSVAQAVAGAPARDVVFEVPRDAPVPVVQPAGTPGARTDAAPRGLPTVPAVSAKLVEHRMQVSGSLVDEPDMRANDARRLTAALPTSAPKAGDAVLAAGVLDLVGEGDVEVALSVTSTYENPRALKRVRWTLEIDGRVQLVEDLALSAQPVQVRIYCRAPQRLPIGLALHVDRDCFPSSAWPRVSRVQARVEFVAAAAHGQSLHATASRGAFARVERVDKVAANAAVPE